MLCRLMCRLFGMSGGTRRLRATFWLLDASDSLAVQSRREPDGTGIGWFDADDRPQLAKQPLAAYADRAFADEARELESAIFVAHLRYATTGAAEARNTHPFQQRGRLFAHNGIVGELDRLEHELGSERELVRGDTDSERLFALVTRNVDRHGGDVGAAIAATARWVADHLPVYAINIVVATSDQLWALRYPEAHQLWVLERPAGGRHGRRHLDAAGTAGTVRVRSHHLSRHASVIVASEPMDEDPAWRLLEPGELVHVAPTLHVASSIVLDGPPARQLSLHDLAPDVAVAQAPPPH
jgi:predicted glutamine amidotransferase